MNSDFINVLITVTVGTRQDQIFLSSYVNSSFFNFIFPLIECMQFKTKTLKLTFKSG